LYKPGESMMFEFCTALQVENRDARSLQLRRVGNDVELRHLPALHHYRADAG
jgi:hypothetical protein